MLTETNAKARGLADLPPVANDSLLALIAHASMPIRGRRRSTSASACSATASATRRSCKVIKEAEQRLRRYAGDQGLSRQRGRQALRGVAAADPARRACRTTSGSSGLQTPGGCGALRLGFELIATRQSAGARARRDADLAEPSADHPLGRLEMVEYPYYERGQGAIRFDDDDRRRLSTARAGRCRAAPRLLPQSDRRRSRPRTSGARSRDVVVERGLLPLVDIAYQGFGRGLDEDALGVAADARRLRRGDRRAELRQEFQRLSRPRRLAVRQDRVARGDRRRRWPTCSSSRARCGRCRPIMARRRCTSSSKIAGAARSAGWSSSTAMRDRINAVRQRIAAADPRLAFIGGQFGMFSMLPLSQGAGAQAARGAVRSTWPTAAASTSSASATTRSIDLSPPWSRRWIA